jgi:hypothetical protein
MAQIAHSNRFRRTKIEALVERSALGCGMLERKKHTSDHIVDVAKASALVAIAT